MLKQLTSVISILNSTPFWCKNHFCSLKTEGVTKYFWQQIFFLWSHSQWRRRPTVHSTFPNIAYIFAHHHLTAPAFSDHFFVIIQSSPGKVAAVGIHEAGILSTEDQDQDRSAARMSGWRMSDVGLLSWCRDADPGPGPIFPVPLGYCSLQTPQRYSLWGMGHDRDV